MSATTKPLRRERRAAQLAARREAARRTAAREARRSLFTLPRITIAAVIGGLALIVAIQLTSRPAPSATDDLRLALAPPGIPAAGVVLGVANAPVSIDLYEDFQCPACRRWGESVFPRVTANEIGSGTATLTYRPFAFLGPESIVAARAAWAADQQGRFWDFWATLYANQGLHENAGAFSRERLLGMADLLGLDHGRFVADLDSAAAARAVADASAAASAAGVNSTPTLMIGGQPVPAGYTELSAAIQAATGR